MKTTIRAALLCSSLVLAAPAFGNDTMAVLGAGGLVLTKTADVRMATEDLTISPDQVRVKYTFVNDSAKDIDAIVAFPMPDIDNGALAEQPMRELKGKAPNFMSFMLKVDGKPVTPSLENRALINGKDVTKQVQAAGLPLSILGSDLYDKIGKLPKEKRAALINAGILGEGGPNDAYALWTTQTRYYWTQHFPAGKTIAVEHTYQPVSGGFHAGAGIEPKSDEGKTYCVDAATSAAIVKLVAARTAKGGEANVWQTDYIVKTANNWKGGIGKFHLTLDKMAPDNVLSLCGFPDIKKTGPTTFEVTRTNFKPAQDIKMIVVY